MRVLLAAGASFSWMINCKRGNSWGSKADKSTLQPKTMKMGNCLDFHTTAGGAVLHTGSVLPFCFVFLLLFLLRLLCCWLLFPSTSDSSSVPQNVWLAVFVKYFGLPTAIPRSERSYTYIQTHICTKCNQTRDSCSASHRRRNVGAHSSYELMKPLKRYIAEKVSLISCVLGAFRNGLACAFVGSQLKVTYRV